MQDFTPDNSKLPSTDRVELETDRESAMLAGTKGLSKEVVLWELWRHALPDQAVMNHDTPVACPADVAQRIAEHPRPDQLDFVWIDGRCLQCSIARDGVDLSGYSEKNQISGVALINTLRAKLAEIQEQKNCTGSEAESFYFEMTAHELVPAVERMRSSEAPSLFDQLFPGNPFNGQ